MSNKASNYYVATSGVFKLLPSKWAAAALAAVQVERTAGLDFWGQDETVTKNQTKVRLGNRTWVPNFVSACPGRSSMSAYWLSEDGQYLLRLSDHWSEGPRGTHVVGNIATCYWEIRGRQQPAVDGFHLGVIKLSELKER